MSIFDRFSCEMCFGEDEFVFCLIFGFSFSDFVPFFCLNL